ncbi:hypothetical protein FQN60_013324 [Etheostoma spectabile]|uniref:Uncharacterized protein n=1 Tax=Etheostoma spectabile TaxID=54343 RepID=A0A5J5D905_9PERO|nr:hypothetical protein FQN60_013324 [Etheostoma spectabile]
MAGCRQWCHRMCVCCLSEEEKTTIAVDREIERILKQQKKKQRREIKILLLGTGESGKTTFIRQMRIIHGRGFSEEERRTFAKCIFQNILTAMKAMTGAMATLGIPYSNPQNEIYAKWLQDINTVQIRQLEHGYVDAIRRLWADSGIRVCYSRRCEYQLLDSTEYYMSNLDRISAPDYIPTEQDVLRVRFPTTGIHDYSFIIKTITLRGFVCSRLFGRNRIIFLLSLYKAPAGKIVDVGGQKSERRKWIHCFENVTSLIFLASLSEYDQVLEERETINRMDESLALFYTTIHSPWFLNTSIILFLNKTDILADKLCWCERLYSVALPPPDLPLLPMATTERYWSFPQALHPHKNPGCKRCNPEDAKNYIRKLYEQQATNRDNKDEWKTLYPHFTCATDTSNIRTVFSDVKDTVLLKSLRDYGSEIEIIQVFDYVAQKADIGHEVVVQYATQICHTDRSLSRKGCSGPAAASQPEHITPLSEHWVLYTRATKLRRAEKGSECLMWWSY